MQKLPSLVLAFCAAGLLVACGDKAATQSAPSAPVSSAAGPVPSPAFLAVAKTTIDAKLAEIFWNQAAADLESAFASETVASRSAFSGRDWILWHLGLITPTGIDSWGVPNFSRGPKLAAFNKVAGAGGPITSTVVATPAGACEPGNSIQISICPFTLDVALTPTVGGPFVGTAFPVQRIPVRLVFDARDGSWGHEAADPLITYDLSESVFVTVIGDEAARELSGQTYQNVLAKLAPQPTSDAAADESTSNQPHR